MAVISWSDGALQSVTIRFDAISVIEHQLSAQVVTHKVEAGADIADHIRPERPTVTVEARISNTPLFSNSGVVMRNNVAAPIGSYRPVTLAKSPVTPRVPVYLGVTDLARNSFDKALPITSVDGLVFDNLESRVREVTEALTDALNNKRLLSVSDEASDYDNMAIESRVITRTAEGGKACIISLQLRQVEFATTSTVDAPISAELRGQAVTSAGSAAAKKSPNEEAKKTELKSLAASLFDGARAGL